MTAKMEDEENTKEQLIKEIKLLKKRIKELDDSESLRKQAEEELQKARDELEKRVEERTADLTKVKEELAIQAWGLEKANEGIKVLYKEREDLLNKFKDLSLKDALTELYNYRYLVERLTSELKRAQRYSLPLSIVMMDIDYFKSIKRKLRCELF